MREIVFHTQTSEKTGVVIENNRINEYVIERPGVKALSGAVFVGRVQNIDHGLQAAFVDIGQGQNAFLRKPAIPWAKESIHTTLKEGEYLFLQVIKESKGNKGPQVSADITLPGLYTIYQPYGRKTSISKKLTPSATTHLQSELEEILSPVEGCIIRTAAADVNPVQVIKEMELLKEQWLRITTEQLTKPPRLIWKDEIIPDQLIRKFPLKSLETIIVDGVEESEQLKNTYPSIKDKISWKPKRTNEVARRLQDLQMEIINSRLEIEGGIEIVIEVTEAMTVVDVNSYKYKGKAFSNSQTLDVNRRAGKEILRQLRLRNISGIIMVDFISMKDNSAEEQLLNEMKNFAKQDLVRTQILGITRLGIMEMTRKNEWMSPLQLLQENPEPVLTVETAVFRLERELLFGVGKNQEAILLCINPQLKIVKKQLLSDSISSKIPQELFVREDPSVSHYQIELEGSVDMIRETIHKRGYHVDNLF
ncbi:ribonuclease E/G [Halobacillus halophilus]|uniref:ribonuclease E/G n=1 Tax=Halobacillus halophilus TaxID=1570 RepID=UPI001CD2F172|nr:ribonuclease E/G [Halobacillus halophilus]MCA1009815.1 ribonuclease E/G [Halobacillus halophilus]